MAEIDNEIEELLKTLSGDLEGVSGLVDKLSQLSNYGIDGPLVMQVDEAIKRIQNFAEQKLESFEIEGLTPEGAEKYQQYLYISNSKEDVDEQTQERNTKINGEIAPLVAQYEEDTNSGNIDENEDIVANAEAWDKETADIQPIEEITHEDGVKRQQVTNDFESFGGFFSSLDEKTAKEVAELARLESIQDLAQKAPTEDKEANKKAYIEKTSEVLDQTGVQLWQEYQKQLYVKEHPELQGDYDFAADEQLEPKVDNPAEYIEAMPEDKIKEADKRIENGEELSITEMAQMCKGRPLLNKPARQELMSVIERAGKAEKIEGDELVALQFLLNETKRVPEYNKLADKEHVSPAQKHLDAFRSRLSAVRNYQDKINTQAVTFDHNTFSDKEVLKSAWTNVSCTRGAALVQKAEHMSLMTKAKGIWEKVKVWDKKQTEKHPKLYPLAKTVVLNTTVSVTTGIAGMTALSGYRLYKQVKNNYNDYKQKAEKAKAEGKEFPKNYRSYFFSKENKEAAVAMGTTALLSAVSVGFGAASVAEHGLSSVTGLAGRLAEGHASAGGSMLSGFVERVKNFDWKNAAISARTASATAISVASGIVAGEFAAQKQRQFEKQLDTMLQQYGAELPTDKKTLKLRSSDPQAYILEVLNQNKLNLKQDKITELNDIAKNVVIKRKEKNFKRWGTLGGSAMGLAFAGFFGAKQDLESQQAQTSPETALNTDTGLRAGASEQAGAYFNENDGNVTLGEKINENDSILNTKIYEQKDSFMQWKEEQANLTGGENSDSHMFEQTAAADGIDINNLSSEQQHDLDMLFKRYPRAASLILEGNADPAVGDTPSNGVLTSAKLQSMYESGQIDEAKLKDMVKFAGEHFDARGNFTGPDAEALNAEAKAWSNAHAHSNSEQHHSTSTRHSNGGTRLEDVEKPQTSNEPQGNSETPAADEPVEEQKTPENSAENSEQQQETPVAAANEPVQGEIIKKGVNLKYTIEGDESEKGYSLTYEGKAKADKDIYKSMLKTITREDDGSYSAANGHIHGQDYSTIRGRVEAAAKSVTIEHEIYKDVQNSGTQLTEAEKSFIKTHEANMDKLGLQNEQQTDNSAKAGNTTELESKGLNNAENKTVENNDTEQDKNITQEQSVSENPSQDHAQNNEKENQPVAAEKNKDDVEKQAETPVQEPVSNETKGEVHNGFVNAKYTIVGKADNSGYSLKYEGSTRINWKVHRALLNGITQDKDGSYTTANGAIRSRNYNIVVHKVQSVCQDASIKNGIYTDLKNSGRELTDAEKMFLRDHEREMKKYGIKMSDLSAPSKSNSETVNTPSRNETHTVEAKEPVEKTSTQTHETVKESTTSDNSDRVAVPTVGNDGYMTTSSGLSFKIEGNGDIVYKTVMSAEQTAKADAEVYKALFAKMNATHEAGVGELAFMSDYAKEHNLSFGGSAQLAENQAASHSSMSETKTAETETPKKTTPQYSASRSRINDDDVYSHSGKGKTEFSNGEGAHTGTAQSQQNAAEIDTQHRISQYRGIKGHYTFISHGAGEPEVDTQYLRNVPINNTLRSHLRATHEWNANASRTSYLGGFIQGNTDDADAKLHNFCKNLEGSDVVYRDMQKRISKGYEPTQVEQRWMKGFEKDIRTLGLDYVDGELTPVKNPLTLFQQRNNAGCGR